ncbi:MAG: type II pantothenate kinase [Firmicutes bacterium]|nr:type II pantothenate kinase [Bacillota bacterium]
MGITVGIDIGGSTTKIVGFRGSEMLKPVQISSNNPVASIFGAFGKFLYDNELELSEVSQVNLSGVGASDVDRPIYGLPTFKVDEFTANGLGGSYFAEGKDNFMVVSMGTGTSYVGVKNGVPRHLGGIGIGGGTIIGLSKYILNTNEIDRIEEMAQQGDIRRIDLQVGDISKEQLPGLRPDTTAASFGKSSSRASQEDKAAGIVHMVLEDIFQTAALIANGIGIKDFVMIGALTNLVECGYVMDAVKVLFPDFNFIIPEEGEYGTAIGTALARDGSLKEIR